MTIQITITDAGRAEIINAQNTGTAPVTITQVGLGSAKYAPSHTQTALHTEVKRLSTIAGEVVADDTIHVTVKDEGNDAYSVGEFGLYTASGTLFAVYSQTTDYIMQKLANSSLLLSVDVVLATLNATSLTFGNVSFTNPPATTEVMGVVELATAAEVQAGTDDERAVTPAGLAARTATETRTGVVELATAAETATGTDNTRAVHPAGLKPLLDAKAPLASPTFTGTPAAPTPTAGDNSTKLSTTAFVQAAIAALVNSSPAALDTLNELATALGNDPNFATTMTNALALKAPLASPTFTGDPKAPTAAQFDADTSLATTEFVQMMLGNLRGGAVCTGTTTLSASHIGKAIQLSGTGPYTVTLPLANGLPDGAMIQFNTSASGVITIQRQGSELIYPNMGPGVASFTMVAGDSAKIVKLNGVWGLLGGSASLRTAGGDFGLTIGSGYGYQKLPSGLIIQWTKGSSNTAGGQDVYHPITFPNAALISFVSSMGAAGYSYASSDYLITGFTPAKTTVYRTTNDPSLGQTPYILAIGN